MGLCRGMRIIHLTESFHQKKKGISPKKCRYYIKSLTFSLSKSELPDVIHVHGLSFATPYVFLAMDFFLPFAVFA